MHTAAAAVMVMMVSLRRALRSIIDGLGRRRIVRVGR